MLGLGCIPIICYVIWSINIQDRIKYDYVEDLQPADLSIDTGRIVEYPFVQGKIGYSHYISSKYDASQYYFFKL